MSASQLDSMALNRIAGITKRRVDDQLVVRVQGEEFFPLSEKPYFDIILTEKNVKPLCQMVIPEKLNSVLPSAGVPVVVTYCNKNWNMSFNGCHPRIKKLTSGWRVFVNDNNLKAGDACVFELTECSSEILKFRVQILRGGLPSEFCDKDDGGNASNPIVIE